MRCSCSDDIVLLQGSLVRISFRVASVERVPLLRYSAFKHYCIVLHRLRKEIRTGLGLIHTSIIIVISSEVNNLPTDTSLRRSFIIIIIGLLPYCSVISLYCYLLFCISIVLVVFYWAPVFICYFILLYCIYTDYLFIHLYYIYSCTTVL